MTRLEQRELRQGAVLLLALSELTDEQRHAVIGRHVRELTFRELAGERGVTESAIYLAEQGGLRRLRRVDAAALGRAA